MNMCEKFRKLLRDKDYLFTPGVANPMQAVIVERAGFDYVYMSGAGTSITQLGLVDIGFVTATEMVGNARSIVSAVDIPVLADADNGYGNAINVIRTVKDFESAGVAGIHLEDQDSPKRCGHFSGKIIIPIEEAIGKIKAAVDAKKNKDFFIIARTDAFTAVGGGFDEALKRGKEYARAGADAVFCEFPNAEIEYPKSFAEKIHREFPDLPLFFNFSSNFKWYNSPLTLGDIAEAGFKIIINSTGCIRVHKEAVTEFAVDLMKRKEQAVKDFQRKEIENLAQFGGLTKFKELEKKYLPSEEVRKRYKTVGL